MYWSYWSLVLSQRYKHWGLISETLKKLKNGCGGIMVGHQLEMGIWVLCRFCVRAFVPAILAEHWNRIPTVSHHHQPWPPVPPVGLEGPGLAFHFICPSLFSRRCHLRSLPFRRYTRLCARRISQETHTGVYDQWCAGNLSVYTTWDSLLKTPVMNGQ